MFKTASNEQKRVSHFAHADIIKTSITKPEITHLLCASKRRR